MGKILHRALIAIAVLCACTLPLRAATAASDTTGTKCCEGKDGPCRIYIIAGPHDSTYVAAALRLKHLLEDESPGGRRFVVKVLCEHDNGQELHGSVHNLYYLLRLNGENAPTTVGSYSESSLGCDHLTTEDLGHTQGCSLALAQADTTYLLQSGILSPRLLAEREMEQRVYSARASDRDATGNQLGEHPGESATDDENGVSEATLEWVFQEAQQSSQRAEGILAPGELRAIASLFREVLHMVVRYPLAVSDLSSLGDFRVYMGRLGSGTRVTASGLLNASGIRTETVIESAAFLTRESSYPRLFDSMTEQRLDAFFVVATPPFRPSVGDDDTTFDKLLGSHRAYLHPFSTGDILRLTALFPLFASTVIPAGTYPGQHAPISTVGIDVLLLGTSQTPNWLTRHLVETLLLHEGDLNAMETIDSEMETIVSEFVAPPFEISFAGLDASLKPADAGHSQSVRYHKGTREFFDLGHLFSYETNVKIGTLDSLRLEWHRFIDYLVYGCAEETHLLFLFTFVILMALLVLGLPRLRVGTIRYINSHPFVAAALGILLVLLFAGTLTFLSEHRRSDFFSNPAEALFSVVVYLLSGFEDRAPVTLWGRAGSTTILIISPVMVALLTGAVFRAVQRHLSEGYVISRRLSHHYVICGWNDRSLGIVLQLRDALLKRETAPIVIVGEPEDEMAFARLREQHADYMHDVRIIARPPTDPMALYSARVGKARAVIVLAADDSDEEATLIVATLKGFANGWKPERRAVLKRLHFLAYKLASLLLPGNPHGAPPHTLSDAWRRAEKRADRWYTQWHEPVVLVESLQRSNEDSSGTMLAHNPSRGKRLDALAKFERDPVFAGRLKVVKGDDMRSRAVAAAARSDTGGLIECLFKLLTFGTDSNELYPVCVADLMSKRRWRTLCDAYHTRFPKTTCPGNTVPFAWLAASLLHNRGTEQKHAIIPVAIRETEAQGSDIGRFDTNPRRQDLGAKRGLVTFGDELLVVAYRQPGRFRRKLRAWLPGWSHFVAREGGQR